MKKGGSAVFMMELLVVILFFAISSTVTLRLFVEAHLDGKKSERTGTAIIMAQSAAEQFHADGLDMFGGKWLYGEWRYENNVYTTETDDAGSVYLEITITNSEKEYGTIYSGEVAAYKAGDPDKDKICSLKLSRYNPVISEVVSP